MSKSSIAVFDADVLRSLSHVNGVINGELSAVQRKLITQFVAEWQQALYEKREKAYGPGLQDSLEKASEEIDSWPKYRKADINYNFHKE